MKFEILSAFPGLFTGVFDETILKRALDQGLIEIEITDLRQFAKGGYVDDYPYSGGPGMVIKSDCLAKALKSRNPLPKPFVIYLSPQGMRLNNSLIKSLAEKPRLVLVCGRYEGIDQRFIDAYVDLEISLGDFVLSGGEIPAMALIDAVSRQIKGVIGNNSSVSEDTFEDHLLKGPVYTRPQVFEDRRVPEILLGGNERLQKRWKKEQSIERTRERRPDLLRKG